ncbi:MAG: DUF6554 family protein [Cyanobacteriota bacterium]|jgi:hypothetical protein
MPPRQRPLIAALAGLSALVALGPSAALAQAMGAADNSPGGKGAQIYCFMRSNGNDHPVSWDAAYALIKRQGSSMFRTSPEHAAVMITEAVVQNPTTYPDCGRFLGDLYKKAEIDDTSKQAPAAGGGTPGR